MMSMNSDWKAIMESLKFPMDTGQVARLLRMDESQAAQLLEELREYDLLDWKQGGLNWFLTIKGEAFCQYLQYREEFEQLAEKKTKELIQQWLEFNRNG
jgi:Mn-dependent DtxR family transcriptional regulator